MIDIKFFAHLQEQLDCQGLQLAWRPGIITVNDLKQRIYEDHPHWQALIDQATIAIAINHQLADINDPIRDGDEVAFFPPVTGG